MSRRATLQLFAVISLIATIGYAVDRSDADAEQTPAADRQRAEPDEFVVAESGQYQLREGMKLVNRVGKLLEVGGGRIEFQPDGDKHKFQVLENLALERVYVSGDMNQSDRMWSVTGIITEYRGGNYLLLQRAVLKPRVSSAPGTRPM